VQKNAEKYIQILRRSYRNALGVSPEADWHIRKMGDEARQAKLPFVRGEPCPTLGPS